MLLQRLHDRLNPQLSEGLGKELEHCYLVVAHKDQLRIAKSFHIPKKAADRETIFINSFARHDVPEHGLALIITDNEHLHSAVSRCFELPARCR